MVKKDLNAGFWSHIIRDSKGIAHQVINKILNKTQGKRAFLRATLLF